MDQIIPVARLASIAKAGGKTSQPLMEVVTGTSGDDLVTLGSSSGKTVAQVNLRTGDDTLRLAGGQDYILKLSGVETVTAGPGANVTIAGRAQFATNGSFDITAQDRSALHVSYEDITDDITLTLGTGRHVITFGAGFDYAVDAEGRLVVSHNGHTLTFEGVDPNSTSVMIVDDRVMHTYSAMLGLATPFDTTSPTITQFTNDHPDGVYADDDRTVTFTAHFSEPVAGVSASDVWVVGGTLTADPHLASDGMSVTVSVEAPLGANGFMYVGLNDTITDLSGNALQTDYTDTRVDLTAPVCLSFWSEAPPNTATNADSIAFYAQFSKPVTNVGADDFVLTGTTATVTGVEVVSTNSSQYEYKFTVSGGDLAGLTGNINLAFAPDENIVDLAGRPMSTPFFSNVTVAVDNTAPDVTVTDVGPLLIVGPGFSIVGTGIVSPDPLEPRYFDWSKIYISVDDGGPNITFSMADMTGTTYGSDYIGFRLSQAKLDEIHSRVDGVGDHFIIAQGFWEDSAGNVQLVGDTIDTPADMF